MHPTWTGQAGSRPPLHEVVLNRVSRSFWVDEYDKALQMLRCTTKGWCALSRSTSLARLLLGSSSAAADCCR